MARVARTRRLALVVVAGLVVACTGSPTLTPTATPTTAPTATTVAASPTATPFPTGPINLTMWVVADGATKPAFENYIKLYQKVRPNVSITVEEFPFLDLHDKMSVALQAGTGAPDLALPEISRFASLLKGSQIGLVDLTDRIRAAGMHLVASRQNNYTYQGKVYGIETDVDPVGLFYRSDLFQQAGITLPIKTWSDYIAAGQLLKQKTGKSMTAIETTDYDVWTPIMLQYGCNFFDTSGKIALDSLQCHKAFNFLVSLVQTYKIAIPAPGGDQYNPTFWGAYSKGDIASIWGAGWMLSVIEGFVAGTKGKWTEQPLPVAPPEAPWDTSTVGGNAMVITNQSKYVDVDWDFIQWLVQNKGLPPADQLFGMPNNTDLWNDPVYRTPNAFLNGQVVGQLWQAQGATLLKDGAPYLNPNPNNPVAYDIFTRDALGPAINGDKSADDALAAAVADLQATIGQ